MSELGQNLTLPPRNPTSAIPPKADIDPLYKNSDYSGYAGYFKITEVTRITGVAKELGWLRLGRGRCVGVQMGR